MMQFVITDEALSRLGRNKMEAQVLLDRHFAGDWGSAYPDEIPHNELALASRRGKMVSRFWLPDHTQVIISTDGRWESTTVFMPYEH